MDKPAQLTEAIIRQHAAPESYRRGQEYYDGGAVLDLVRRGDQLQADVEGSQYEPYQVRITLDPGVTAYCTCPYDWGGWCKHIVAAALAAIHQADQVEERPAAVELLADLEAPALRDLVLHLLQRQPELVDAVELFVEELRLPPAPAAEPAAAGRPAPRPRQTPVDAAAYGRQVRRILRSLDRMRSSEAYGHVEGVVDEVRELLGAVEGFLTAGDGANALAILEAITQEYVADWTDLDDSDGYVGAFFPELGAAWAEALLTAELTREERRSWAGKLAHWQEEIDDYGIDEAFDAALAAAEQGWDYAPLRRVLAGESTEQGAWAGEAPWFADELTQARLNVLARQGRHEEYLRLAAAEGQTGRYVTMLVRLGRIQEAVADGLQYLATVDEALALAQVLRERGAQPEAVRIAEHGLTLEGHKGALADWLAELATALGDPARARAATILSFRAHPQLATYLRVRELAGAQWAEARAGLLADLGRSAYVGDQVEIYLHEGLLPEAIQAVEAHPWSYDTLEKVVQAALVSQPDWVIRQCRAQAEPLMDGGKADRYHHAVRWLGHAREAYRQAGRAAEWQDYLRGLLDRHRRKYRLVPILQGLRG